MVKRVFLPTLLTLLSLLVILTIALASRRSTRNYLDPDGPLYEGAYAADVPEFDGIVKVITWNIAFAKEVETAIAELKEVEELFDADIILLQEMDETGVEAIAQSLGHNYVYYPASIHHRHGRNFGNAVLSKWPLSEPEKVILPHHNPTNDQIRIAVRAVATIDDIEVPVYSVHTETYWLSDSKRLDQVDLLANEVEPDFEYTLAGGDFNTLTSGSISALEARLMQAGLERVSVGAGESVKKGGIGFEVDHIFARGMSPLRVGVWEESQASDHFPVWVDLSFDPEA